jgi:tetratricopeptide (TPR) repeat protein
VRKVLLRGLMPRAKDRWPSMEALLEALGKDPSVQRRKWIAAAGGMMLIGGVFLGGRAIIGDQNQVCSGGPPKLAGIWDLPKPGEPEPARHAQIRKAFMATGKSYAPDVFATVSRALTTYAQNWANMYKEACEATQVRRDQSADVMDLRMECLQERLGGVRALTEVFSDASSEIVENAVRAANSLEPLDRCANVPLLRAVIRPPDDPATRAKAADLRNRLADIKAQFAAGRWKEMLRRGPALVDDARRVGYQPLTIESLAVLGMMLVKAKDPVAAEKALTEAYWAADASRHDEVRAEVAADLVYVVGYQQAHFEDARRWATATESVLNRMGGHELLRAWLLNDLAAVSEQEGDREAALRLNLQALALKRKVLGGLHPDVALSETNLATALSGLGRNNEALTHVESAIAISEQGLGAAHPDVALPLNNRGEILRLLGRYPEARLSFERARDIWQRELGPENAWVGYALTGIGATFVAEGNPNSALVPLERAGRILKDVNWDPLARAETNFLLARALRATNRDRARARALAEQARTDYARTSAADKLTEVVHWLETIDRSTSDRVARR